MATLLSLPLETLELITSHLTSHKPSLHAFSKASKRCAAASRIRFRGITLRLSRREDLDLSKKHWDEILKRNSAFSSVRHLFISGRIPLREDQNDAGALLPKVIVEHDRGEDELTCRGEVYDDILRGQFYQLGVEEEMSDAPWMRFAVFLEKLTGLKEVVWACERVFPQPLLRVLQRIPGCRLHVKAFDPPWLVEEKVTGFETDDDEDEDGGGQDGDSDTALFSDAYGYTLATSPCLTSVVVPVAHDDPYREDNEGMVRWMVRGLAPNLKHVHIIDTGPGFRYRKITRTAGRRPSIKNKNDGEMGLGQLTSLSLDPANEARLESWDSAIDFSRLRTLQLWRARKVTLARARSCKLSSLKDLALDVVNDRHSLDTSPVDRAVANFLKCLPPLRSLHLTGPWEDETFKTTLKRHGRALRKLSLYPSASRRHFHQFALGSRRIALIGKHCPHLRDARLQVKRSAGDAKEQGIYQAVGALPNVRHLTLQLDIYDPVAVAVPMAYLAPNSEDVRGILINMAVDAMLAKEIAHLIFSQGRAETVILGLGINATGKLGDLARYMKREWKCVRIPKNNPGDFDFDVDVQEIGVERRKRRQDGEVTTELANFTDAFARVWPPNDDDPSSWRHVWHSFPLQRVEG
ncbi:hypothetical protein BJY01DRAFT_219387 [Aspergillus pseudoustus]|uniref:F-box domain-containing protein n=1 Tax=Aspergillus pseudoustus TaxID=1810923 RepID=A0ABR4JGM9_9EURO